jgi:uncharacterized protein YjbJ (UPF0337 family)
LYPFVLHLNSGISKICGKIAANKSKADFHQRKEEKSMNWDQIEGNWKQVKGQFKEKWGKLTDDDLDILTGKKDQIVGKLQEKYGWKREEAEKEVNAYIENI